MLYERKRLLVFMAIVLLASDALAQSLDVTDITINPSVVWLEENAKVTVSAKCRYNSSVIQAESARVDIQSPSGLTTTETLRYSSGTYSATVSLYGFSDVGTYTASVSCQYLGLSKTASKIFSVRSMELSIVKDSKEIDAYIGDVFELKIDFRVDGSSVALSKSDYKIKVGDIEADVLSVVGMSGYQKLGIDICGDTSLDKCMKELPEGLYDLTVTAYYSSSKSISVKEKNYVRVNPPMKISFKNDRVECSVGAVCNPEIEFTLSHTSTDSSPISKNDVSARILGNRVFEKAYVEDVYCSQSSCKLKINIPANLQPGIYDLFVAIEKDIGDNSYTVEEPLTLEVVLRLSGIMTDAAGEVVNSAFTLTNLNTGQIVSTATDSSGRYSINLLPGYYSLEARMRGTVVKFSNVTISSTDFLLGILGNPLRYDEGHLNSDGPPGVRTIKVFAVELALPFSSAWFYVPYDSSLVNGDENNLKVYRCSNWNLDKGMCSSSWVEVKAEVHTIRNAVEFVSDSASAFIIGEQRALHMQNIELESAKVNVGDTIVVNGKVLDSDGHPVEGAQIRLSFPAFNMVSSTESTTGGFFRATITAPYTTGYPDLVVRASKASYAPAEAVTTLEVSMKKELSILDVPESKEIRLDEPASIHFKVFNSGQLNLTQLISVRVTGIPQAWYELSQSKIEYLGISEQKDIELKIMVPSQSCGEKCDKFYLVNIEASSTEASDTSSFNLAIVSQNKVTSTDSGGGLFNIPDVTGFSIVLPSTRSIYLPLTVVVILLVLIVNKKKAVGALSFRGKRKGGKTAPKLRDSVMASVSSIKKEL